jgi:Pyridoxamine 5'-phosphate oxidase
MASWSDLEREVPELTSFARSQFDAHTHKSLATIRRDASPRVSGIEVEFQLGEMWIGSMSGARKGADLRRDPRLALHSGMDEPDAATGDAKIAGVALLVDDPGEVHAYLEAVGATTGQPAEPFDLFRVDITELVTIRLGEPADHLVIESWHPGTGYQRIERR